MVAVWTVANAQVEAKVKVIDQAEFAALFDKDVIETPAVIDFNATWCGPCRRLAPVLEELASEYKGKVDFYSIDVDQNKDLAKALGIRSIPYVLYIGTNGEPEVSTGLIPKENIKAKIDKLIK